MVTKVVKKKHSTRAKSSVKKKTATKKVVAKKHTAKKLATKKKPAAPKRSIAKSSAKKKTANKKVATKKHTAKKLATKKKPAAPKRSIAKSAAKKKTANKKVATKKHTAKRLAAKKKPAAPKRSIAKSSAERSARSYLKKKVVKKKAVAKQVVKKKAKKVGLGRSKKYMNPQHLAYFRELLMARRMELIKEANRTADYIQSDSTTYADTIDQANQEEEFTLQLKERDRERKLLQKIDEALIKIDQRTYGFCISCGAEIGVHRLQARPTTDQCIDCKELEEIKERH
ncbi:MAG: RNA polymerase-binding protein DksA [Chromatiales bacterium]|nr:RNA polymerase-binding protein DksA [Chromatiales bacterium]